jgi:hypothetical protein
MRINYFGQGHPLTGMTLTTPLSALKSNIKTNHLSIYPVGYLKTEFIQLRSALRKQGITLMPNQADLLSL